MQLESTFLTRISIKLLSLSLSILFRNIQTCKTILSKCVNCSPVSVTLAGPSKIVTISGIVCLGVVSQNNGHTRKQSHQVMKTATSSMIHFGVRGPSRKKRNLVCSMIAVTK